MEDKMNTGMIWQLYPTPAREVKLNGLYLGHDLRQYAADLGRAFVYTNYVTSLDGRIAIPRPEGKGMMVPSATANDRDWRMFQELAVQADVIITSGRYLRDYAEGKAQEVLRVYDDPRFEDLGRWRADHDLSPYPDLAVVSGSLDFPVPEFLTRGDRHVVIVTHGAADPERRRDLEAQAGQVVVAGETAVSGKQVVAGLSQLGYKTIYMATGPRVHHLLLADDALDRLYTTFAHRLLGGQPFSSLVEGPLLDPAIGLRLNALYFDPHALDGLGQLFIAYER
jgi:riboflavin biosynthesis pyrimidine reductase